MQKAIEFFLEFFFSHPSLKVKKKKCLKYIYIYVYILGMTLGRTRAMSSVNYRE